MANREHAIELLNNPLFTELAQRLAEKSYEDWINSESIDAREEIFRRVKAIDEIHSEIIAATLETRDGDQ